MSDHKSDRADMGEEEVEHQLPVDLRRLLCGPKIPAFNRNSNDLREWFATLDESRTVYGLLDRETLYLAYNATRGKASVYEGTLS